MKFDELRSATDRIREGDLRVEIEATGPSGLTDEMDDLAQSLGAMLGQLRQLVLRVQQAATSVSDSSSGLEGALDSLKRNSEDMASTANEVTGGVDQEQELLGQASDRMAQVSSEIELNAGARARSVWLCGRSESESRHRRRSGTARDREDEGGFERAESTSEKVFELEAKTRTFIRLPRSSPASPTAPTCSPSTRRSRPPGPARPGGILGRRRRDPQALRERGSQRGRDQPAHARDSGVTPRWWPMRCASRAS